MAKKLFSTTLFLIYVVGCSKVDNNTFEESIGTCDCDAINFVAQTTKATTNELDSMKSDANGFVVYGVEINSSSWYDYLDGNKYIYNSTSETWEWEDDKTPSWPLPFNQMNFYALYPDSAEGFTISTTPTSSIVGDIVVQQSILDQTDYLAAASGDVMTKPSTGVLPLQFTHIMSKISFSVLQDEGILTIIRQLGIENIISEGSYDYMTSTWYNLSNSNLTSFDDYVGSSGPFAKYGVADQVDPIRIDGHDLMLIPQKGGDEDGQTPVWDGSITDDNSGDFAPSGAYISIRYRTSVNDDSEDLVGYAFRENTTTETEWTNGYYHSTYRNGGRYNGPLYIKAAFRLTPELLDWEAGSEYDYTLQLNQIGGIYLSEYYYDVDGTNTKIRVKGRPCVGDPVISTNISADISVVGWTPVQYSIYSL
ncbi:MAG: fimbrillin family protein [Rikenellaceae bacterium]